jgi:hypothetical protein
LVQEGREIPLVTHPCYTRFREAHLPGSAVSGVKSLISLLIDFPVVFDRRNGIIISVLTYRLDVVFEVLDRQVKRSRKKHYPEALLLAFVL